MIRKRLAIWLLGLSLTNAGLTYAHHSFAAMYDGNKPVRLKGVLTKVEWTNPHSYFYLDVKGADGKSLSWTCEGANPSALSRRGLNKGDLKIGDTIIVDGYAAKDGSRNIDARRITLKDGRIIHGGTPGDGGPTGAPTAAKTPAP